jgi:hypothetical protein
MSGPNRLSNFQKTWKPLENPKNDDMVYRPIVRYIYVIDGQVLKNKRYI